MKAGKKKGIVGSWLLIKAEQNPITLKWHVVLASFYDVIEGVKFPRCVMSQGNDTIEQGINACMDVCDGLSENEYK